MTTTTQPSATRRPRRPWYAAGTLLAAAAGAGLGHLVAGFVSPESSPVLAVGSTVIDATPTPVKEWAVSTFGTADKPILVASVTVVTLVLAAAVGLVARSRRSLGLGLLGALALLALAAAAFRPTSQPVDVIPGLVTAVVGVLAAQYFLGLLDRAGAADADPAAGAGPDRTAHQDGRSGRRTVIAAAAGLGAVAATGGGLGQTVARRGAPSDIVLPSPTNTLEPLPQGLEEMVRGITSFRTPNDAFYRIDTALVIPRVDAGSWSLTVDGDVDNPFELSYAELLELPMIEKDITMTCVSNPVGGPYVGAARWLGVPVRELLERAGVRGGVDQIFSRSTDGMTISTPLQALMDDRDALVAVGMNGEPLPPVHGFPARLVTPGLYGFVGATKWLTQMTATTYDAEQAYWTERDWAIDAPIYTQSRIDTPKPLSTVDAGEVTIGGVAWAQQRGIAKVEVRVDEGEWREAELGPEANIDYWRQWFYRWDAEPGRHTLEVRATDEDGQTQTEQRQEPFPEGATGWHSVVMTVA
ncbi:molybdopterin-dependent oxidoreductase [Phycicoccus sp. BSK3Z-2]|uniref:Molybdopterin-dependent oxidoreductase n=1 Tax=Phycicoccus avicenniae TaxID=2828860 RepID=A0A941I014_9MICO|nr:molybdopterin-dependent oxidoreductase [Phycicoccus avicenniae]MBR7744698.1 molybdopterin-dependent oxidoreductase [Phycicoccus avicenniae]